MPISFDYDETRALAKQFRELTGRDIKHTQIIEAIATVKGMKADALMHMLKNADEAQVVNWTSDGTERVFFQGKGLLDVLRRELDLPTDPNLIPYFMVGVFDVVPVADSSIFELGVMRRAVMDALIEVSADPRTIVGFLDSQHFVIAFPYIVNIDGVPALYDNLLTSVPRSSRVDNGALYFHLIGAVTDVSGSENLDKALLACKANIPEIRKRSTSVNKGHEWGIVHDWE